MAHSHTSSQTCTEDSLFDEIRLVLRSQNTAWGGASCFTRVDVLVFPLSRIIGACCSSCRSCLLMIFGFFFFQRRSIISLFETPVGEETSVFAAISGEHIRDSAGLTVADKSRVINTLAHTRTRAHRHSPFRAGCWWRPIVGGTTDVWVSADNQPSH